MQATQKIEIELKPSTVKFLERLAGETEGLAVQDVVMGMIDAVKELKIDNIKKIN